METIVVAVAVLAIALGAIAWAVLRVAAALRARHGAEMTSGRVLQLLVAFAPGVVAARRDPAAILAWQPVVATARALFPSEFAQLDAAAGAPFPFSPQQIQDAHSQWTADWLAWEQAHNGTFKVRVAEAEAELAVTGTVVSRARLDAIEREKIDQYQARYGQYVRVSKALQALVAGK